MEKKSRSVTAEGAAIWRALHQTLDAAPKILDDPIAPLLIDLASETNKAYIARVESMTSPVKSPFRAGFVMRSRYTEDCLAESLVRGVRQYVILGAGLDTFAYRQPAWGSSIRIYEVDHPASQGGKVGGPNYLRMRDDASGAQNVIWGMPWISNEPFPGLAYCIGGRSLFWGGWATVN